MKTRIYSYPEFLNEQREKGYVFSISNENTA